MLGWMLPRFSTRMPPMQPPKACLSDSAGLPRGGHFLHFLFDFSLFLSLLAFFFSHSFTLKSNKASVGLKAVWCVHSPLTSFTDTFFPFPLSPYILSVYISFHSIITHIQIQICSCGERIEYRIKYSYLFIYIKKNSSKSKTDWFEKPTEIKLKHN